MGQDRCKYSPASVDSGNDDVEGRCANPAHENGLCKFHLDGYLNADTADEVREMFWGQCNNTGEGETVNCNGYILPSLAREGKTATLGHQLCLDNAVFGPDAADFSGIVFERPVSFKSAKFDGGANFQGCSFKNGADFSDAVFFGAAKFEGSRFSESSNFFGATFNEAAFSWARLASANFNMSDFKEAASFYESEFVGAVDFRHARFQSKSDFASSEFEDGADFSDAAFMCPMYFRKVTAKCPSLVKFDGNVSNVSFLDTDVKEISFGSRTTWAPHDMDKNGRTWLKRFLRGRNKHAGYAVWNKKWRIYDERVLDSDGHDLAINHENLKSVYRDMRDNFDRDLAYDVSSGFFVREMEVARRYTNDKDGRICPRHPIRSALTWHASYNVLSEYGQSLGRPLFWLAMIFVAGVPLLWCPTGIPHALEIPGEEELEDSVLRALMSMAPIPFSAPHEGIDLGLKLLSLPPSATFLIALRRRFEKSLRH